MSGTDAPDSRRETEQSTPFDVERVSACELVVEAYRKGEISKPEACLSILDKLEFESAIGDTERSRRRAAYTTFLAQLDEVDERQAVQPQSAAPTSDQGLGEGRSETQPTTEDLDEQQDARRGDGSGRTKRKRASDERDETSSDGSSRRSVDDTLLPFLTGGPNLAAEGLPSISATLLLKENYLRDVSYVKQRIVCHPDCPEVPSSTWNDLIGNQYIDLDKLHTATQTTDGDQRETLKLGDGIELVSHSTKVVKRVETHGDWINAWETYHVAVVFLYPHRDGELRHYRNYINGLFRSLSTSHAKQVVAMDKYIRLQVARSNKRLLSDTASFQDAFTMFILATGAASQGTAASARSVSRTSTTTEPCRRFNAGRCPSQGNCKYRHVCLHCRSRDHISTNCDKAPQVPAAGRK